MRLHDQGKRLPKTTGEVRYAEILGQALRQEFGDRRFAAKTVGRWTQASERTIKNWFAGRTFPTGEHLIKLIARSDAALETVLAASRRADLLEAFYAFSRRSEVPARRASGTRHVTDRGTVSGPEDGTKPAKHAAVGPAERQTWFLAELIAGETPNLASLGGRFGISTRTAKRDVANLRAGGAIKYQGTPRAGRYVLAAPDR